MVNTTNGTTAPKSNAEINRETAAVRDRLRSALESKMEAVSAIRAAKEQINAAMEEIEIAQADLAEITRQHDYDNAMNEVHGGKGKRVKARSKKGLEDYARRMEQMYGEKWAEKFRWNEIKSAYLNRASWRNAEALEEIENAFAYKEDVEMRFCVLIMIDEFCDENVVM